MSDFNTTIRIKGKQDSLLNILKIIKSKNAKQSKWYFESVYINTKNKFENSGEVLLDSLSAKELKDYIKDIKGSLYLSMSGPYGDFRLLDEVDLFKIMADAAPDASFKGTMEGFSAGGNQRFQGELKKGVLFLRSVAGNNEGDEIENENIWDNEWTYEPIVKQATPKGKSRKKPNTVTIEITFIDTSGNKYTITLETENINHTINIYCYPERFLEAESVSEIMDLVINGFKDISGKETEKFKNLLEEFKSNLSLNINDLRHIELIKIRDHKTSLYFDWLRSSSSWLDPEIKKMAKKICTGAEKNKEKNCQEFEKYLETYEPCYPGSTEEGWPNFCLYEWLPDSEGNILAEPNPNKHCAPRFDWHMAADSIEEFAKLICGKKNPKDYLEERVLIDYKEKTIEQTAVYTPGGPSKAL